MQSGVKFWMEIDGSETTPKHLRTGVNAAMSDQGGLVKLLISKGLFTEEEYYAALVEFMEKEVRSYETLLSGKLGKKVNLL